MTILPKIKEASIDLSTICQLRCIECSTSKGITHNGIVGKGQFSISQFVEFVNTKSDFAFEGDKIIERNKWTKLFGNEFCFDGKRKLFFKDSNTAFVVDNQFSKIFKSMTLIKGILI